MCAIAGILNLACNPDTANGMLATMARRGPDGNGAFLEPGVALLHARLAVMDPEGGKQPMALKWQGETYILVYNGELYNTSELRRELERLGHRFSERSDTEVLLHALAEWGEECLQRLNGIYAFALWQARKRRLFLARDRMGVKPLFWAYHGEGFLFASEIKTILAYPTMTARLDARGAAELVMFGPGRMPGSGVLRDIYELEPGTCAVYEDGKLRVRRYWRLMDREHTQTFAQTAENVRELVTDAICRQMISDVPLGTFLSGGLDSSLITAVCAAKMAKKGEKLHTFSVDYADNDKYFTPNKFQPNADGHYIRLMQAALLTEHRWCVLTPQELVDNLDAAVRARDLPGMADVDISLLCFCREIRKNVTVAISGECADEIFGGYPWYRDPQVRDSQGFPWAQNTDQRASLLHPAVRDTINCADMVRAAYERTCRESDILPGTSALEMRMKQMVNLNLRWFMQTLLDRKDRMSMYSGLEVRVPFCDHRIAEYLYGVPWEFKDHNGKEKGLLRTAFEGLLPEAVLWRRKSPYPKTFDPRFLELVSKRLTQLLDDRDARIFDLLDRKQMRQILTREAQWPWYGQLMKRPQTICYLLQVDSWLRQNRVKLIW